MKRFLILAVSNVVAAETDPKDGEAVIPKWDDSGIRCPTLTCDKALFNTEETVNHCFSIDETFFNVKARDCYPKELQRDKF